MCNIPKPWFLPVYTVSVEEQHVIMYYHFEEKTQIKCRMGCVERRRPPHDAMKWPHDCGGILDHSSFSTSLVFCLFSPSHHRTGWRSGLKTGAMATLWPCSVSVNSAFTHMAFRILLYTEEFLIHSKWLPDRLENKLNSPTSVLYRSSCWQRNVRSLHKLWILRL